MLEQSSNLNTKVSYALRQVDFKLTKQYIALQILEKLVQLRWKTLPVDQQQGKLAASSRRGRADNQVSEISLSRLPSTLPRMKLK